MTPKYINSLVELVSNGLDALVSDDLHPTTSATGFIEGVSGPEACRRHFCAQLLYIRARKEAALNQAAAHAGKGPDWGAVVIASASKKFLR